MRELFVVLISMRLFFLGLDDVRRLVGEYDVARDGVGLFLYMADEGAVDFDFRAVPALTVIGGQLCCPFDLGIRRIGVVRG